MATKTSIVFKAVYLCGKETTVDEIIKMTNIPRNLVEDNLTFLMRRKLVLVRREYEKHKSPPKYKSYYQINKQNIKGVNYWLENKVDK